RDHWEDWLAALTASGEETKLRSAIRRLLRGIPRQTLAQETKDELKHHLADSYWRSIGAEIALGNEAGRLEALALLDQAERISAAEDMPLWLAWTRAWLHNALERTAARDEAIGEVDRIMQARLAAATAELRADFHEESGGDPRPEREMAAEIREQLLPLQRIDFPDGLSASWKAARVLLTGESATVAAPHKPTDREGPEGRLRVRWTFTTEGQAPVVSVLPLDAERLLISDVAGDLHGVDRRSGKLLWHLPGAYTARGVGAPGPNAHLAPARPPVRAPGGSFFLPAPGRVLCHGPDGTKRWEASLGATGGQTTPVALATDARGVYVYESASGEVACFRHADGKLVWHRRLRMKAQSTPLAQGEGMALSEGRLLVYGPRTAILDLEDGTLLWSFEPDRARSMPVTLEEPDDETRGLFGRRRRRSAFRRRTAAATPAAQPGAQGALTVPGRFASSPQMPRLLSGRARPASPGALRPAPQGPVFLTPGSRSPQTWSPKVVPTAGTAGVAPAVYWASPLTQGEGRLGLLAGSRMVLARNRPVVGTNAAQGEAILLDTDLPMFARTERILGTPVAMFGPRLALLQRGRLVVWHLEHGTRARFDLKEIAEGRVLYRVQVVQDGGFLYLAGPGGLLCIHMSTLKEVFRAPWPEAAKPTRNDDPSNLQHLLRGTIEFRPTRGWSPMLPGVGMAGRHTLYTLSDPWRVVALEDDTDGR
ncbi:MAG: PQQ-binding-like beta-propeller repeat protein, partial [Planctomycetota bacterium]|nr:PQQ-binding-like beta-propeller repeat protein [Planctomycetota bacterium]